MSPPANVDGQRRRIAVSLLRLAGPQLIGDYRVYVDLAPVFAPGDGV